METNNSILDPEKVVRAQNRREIKDYLELNENENTTIENFLRGIFIAVNAFI